MEGERRLNEEVDDPPEPGDLEAIRVELGRRRRAFVADVGSIRTAANDAKVVA